MAKKINIFMITIIGFIILVAFSQLTNCSNKQDISDEKIKQLLNTARVYSKEGKIDEIITLLEPYAETAGNKVISPAEGMIPTCINAKLGSAYFRKHDYEHALPYLEASALLLTETTFRFKERIAEIERDPLSNVYICRKKLINNGKKLDILCVVNEKKRIKCEIIDGQQYIILDEFADTINAYIKVQDNRYNLAFGNREIVVSVTDEQSSMNFIKGIIIQDKVLVPVLEIVKSLNGQRNWSEQTQILRLSIY